MSNPYLLPNPHPQVVKAMLQANDWLASYVKAPTDGKRVEMVSTKWEYQVGVASGSTE